MQPETRVPTVQLPLVVLPAPPLAVVLPEPPMPSSLVVLIVQFVIKSPTPALASNNCQ
jgi:hypothetical protein